MAAKVSVVMSVYNGEQHLREAIDSILGQTFGDFEFLIVDDGSRDGSWRIIEDAATKDSRIVPIRQENQGLTPTLNQALRRARGRYVARQDADDISEPHRLETMLERIGDASLAVSGWKNLTDGHLQTSRAAQALRLGPLLPLSRMLRYGNFLAHGTFFFVREEVLRWGGYREKFRAAQDYDLLLRVLDHSRIRVVGEPLYRLRLHSASISHQRKESQTAYALLASLMAEERRRGGTDSYERMDEAALPRLIAKLSARLPVHARLASAYLSLRTRDPELVSRLRSG